MTSSIISRLRWLTIIAPTPRMKYVKAADKGLTALLYGKAVNKGLIPDDGDAERGLALGFEEPVPPPATQMVVKTNSLWEEGFISR